MRNHARALKGELEGKAAAAVAAQSGVALGLVARIAVLREAGVGAVPDLDDTTTAAAASSPALARPGGRDRARRDRLQRAHKFDMRLFFQITGILIILFAAGLVSPAILFLQSSGDLGSWDLNDVYDVTRSTGTQDTQSGRFLAGIFGWDPRPSIEQVVGYWPT